jgi:hypothetical protein
MIKNHDNEKLELNEHGVSAKKAEDCLAASCESGLTDIGQSGSVPVGQKEISAPHLDAEQLKAETGCTEEKAKAEKPAPEAQADSKPKAKADNKTEHKTGSKTEHKTDSKTEHGNGDHQSVATIGLEVAAGLAIMAVDSAGKVLKDAGKNWEDKVDAAASKAHETIESAQRAIRDPLGETLKQMDHLAHPEHAGKPEKKV